MDIKAIAISSYGKQMQLWNNHLASKEEPMSTLIVVFENETMQFEIIGAVYVGEIVRVPLPNKPILAGLIVKVQTIVDGNAIAAPLSIRTLQLASEQLEYTAEEMNKIRTEFGG